MNFKTRRRHHQLGVTLIELLVALAIAAILGAIAYPSFLASIHKSRRADATSALTKTQQALERWRSSHSAYTNDLALLGLPSTSGDGYYSLTITLPASGGGTTYEVTATAQNGQLKDTKCRKLTVTMTSGGNLAYSSADSSGAVTSSTGNPCWVR